MFSHKRPVVHTCPHCGAAFTKSKFTPYCSEECEQNDDATESEYPLPGLFVKLPNGRMMRELGLAEERRIS